MHQVRRYEERWTSRTSLSPITPQLRRKRCFLRFREALPRSPFWAREHPRSVNSHWREPICSSRGTSREKSCPRNMLACSMSSSYNWSLQELTTCMPFADLPSSINVASNPGGAYAAPMAEHILAMTLALAKRLLIEHRKLMNGEFDDHTLSCSLYGATAGHRLWWYRACYGKTHAGL